MSKKAFLKGHFYYKKFFIPQNVSSANIPFLVIVSLNYNVQKNYKLFISKRNERPTAKIEARIERLRESRIYVLEIAKFLSGLDSNKNGVVSKSLDNSYRNFRKMSSGF